MTLGSSIDLARQGSSSLVDRLARRAMFAFGKGLVHGSLDIVDDLGCAYFGAVTSELPIKVGVRVHDLAFYRRLLLGGTIGAGESYMDGHYEVDDLVGFVRLFAKNRELLSELDGKLTRLVAPWLKLGHALNRNTPRGSQKNIAAHYDLGNDFYRLFLDESMSYSCAWFASETDDLETAQLQKIERILDQLDPQPGEHWLEIGTGWGALAIAAARRGVRVTTSTISREQARFAQERVREAGLEPQVTVLTRDYRELTGSYQKIVSVEMLEAVGHEYYDAYFQRLDSLLAPGGRALIQTITLPDEIFESAKDEVDFIKRHVFPGSCLPSIARIRESSEKTRLSLTHLEDLGAHYAPTLAAWRARFHSHWGAARALGYDERFLRGWDFYLALSEGAFRERYIGDAQLTFTKR
jgi:cyclopropane-fatty-acyl-phospholipid synthase